VDDEVLSCLASSVNETEVGAAGLTDSNNEEDEAFSSLAFLESAIGIDEMATSSSKMVSSFLHADNAEYESKLVPIM